MPVKYSALILIGTALAACGGGGGDSNTSKNESSVNAAPVVSIQTSANAGISGNNEIAAGQAFSLNGGASHDPEGSALDFEWTLTSKPSGSSATIDKPDASNIGFTADRPGLYTFNLQATDNKGASSNSSVSVMATTDNCAGNCIDGVFVDEPVAGLNYSCDAVRGVTDQNGLFSCPANSLVQFYLQAPNGQYRIMLGDYRAKAVGNLNSLALNTVLQVTPRDLAPAVAASDTLDNSPDGIRVKNILRLLQALDSEYHIGPISLSRIVISNADKSFIDTLGKNINASSFVSNSLFEQDLKPWLNKIAKPLPTATVAVERFNKSLPVLHSGVYEVQPIAISQTTTTGEKVYTGMLGTKAGSNQRALESMLFIIDRDGKPSGLGFEWQSDLGLLDDTVVINNQYLLPKLLTEQAPTPLHMPYEDLGFSATGMVKNFKLNILTTNAKTNRREIDGRVVIEQGQMLKDNMSGNDFFYRNVHGLATTDPVDDKVLGKWKRVNAQGVELFSGTVNMNKTRSVSPVLDGSVWRTLDNATIGEKPIFPLHLKLTLRDTDTSNPVCAPEGCLVGVMGISILADGNIISDRDNDCREVRDTVNSLSDEDGSSEHRMGMVTAAFKESGQSFISPVILVGSWVDNMLTDPNEPWKNFYGVQIGLQSSAGGSRVKINVTNAVSKQVAMLDNQTPDSTDPARWVNYARFFQSLYKGTNNQPLVPEATTHGTITKIETQACYNPAPKL